jgi:hypothetical protein
MGAMTLSITIKKHDTQHNGIKNLYIYAECRLCCVAFILSVGFLYCYAECHCAECQGANVWHDYTKFQRHKRCFQKLLATVRHC